MAHFEFTYFILDDEKQIFRSTAEARLTKKDLKETEAFIRQHNYSTDFVDIPALVYDKCTEQAYEAALRDFPEISDRYDELYIDLEVNIPVSLIMLLSDEVKRKMLTDEPYYMDESEIFPETAHHPSLQPELMSAPAPSSLSQPEVPALSQQAQISLDTVSQDQALYLTIKQQFFDQIVAGTKKEEYREIKPTTYKKYLRIDEGGYPVVDASLIDLKDPLCGDLCVWNGGIYPYEARTDYQVLRLAVGYHKERDEALVEIEKVTFEPIPDDNGEPFRFEDGDGGDIIRNPEGPLCFWMVVYHLGRVFDVRRVQAE